MSQYRIKGFAVAFDAPEGSLEFRLARHLAVPGVSVSGVVIEHRSIDARMGRGIAFVHTLRFFLPDNIKPKPSAKGVECLDDFDSQPEGVDEGIRLKAGSVKLRPVVVGMGPSGLFAALELCRAGAPPLVIERGGRVEQRGLKVDDFWRKGLLDPESNVLFGEGGAGLFSDGKLTSRSKDSARSARVLEAFVRWGGPESIRYDASAHLGTDRMHLMMRAARRELASLGAELRFNCKLERLQVEKGIVRGVVLRTEAGIEEVAAERVILAPGHSASDTYRMLRECGVGLMAKDFAVGVRVEHPQTMIDHAQFGNDAGHHRLGAASYRWTCPAGDGLPACYTFCMCPGGEVIACASEAGRLATNGMSSSSRNLAYGNAAFLVPVSHSFWPEDSDCFAGLAWQGRLEEAAFKAGGGDYALPATSLAAFLGKAKSGKLPYFPDHTRVREANLGEIMPDRLRQALLRGIQNIGKKMRDFFNCPALVYGMETRSSSPLRILRDEVGESTTAKGLYPCGEGAGYAGGIMSSAIDGLCAAEACVTALAV